MSTITIVSLNLWADAYLKRERTDFLLDLFKKNYDVILLQQVSNGNVIEVTRALRDCGYKYKLANENRTVFELVASKWGISDYHFNHYTTSGQNRGLLWADINIRGRIITVASTELEKGGQNTAKRFGQLSCALRSLPKHNDLSIIGCDTGITAEEYYKLRVDWKDAWIASGEDNSTEYTIDPQRNNLVNNGEPPSRPDRIFYQGAFQIVTFELVGVEQTVQKKDSEPVNPSVHFGIKVTLRY